MSEQQKHQVIDRDKIDILELCVQSVIKATEKNIYESSDKVFKIDTIPLDDPKTFKIFSDGLTVGVFQFESSGM